jgi:hypothetical protein
MRMPILAYFIVIGATLLLLLNVSSYALPDVGPPIKTSQLVGLPKVEPRPDAEAPSMSTSNFGAPMVSADTKLPDTIFAKDTSVPKRQSAHLTKERQSTNKNHRSASREHRSAAWVAAVYSHDVMMDTH